MNSESGIDKKTISRVDSSRQSVNVTGAYSHKDLESNNHVHHSHSNHLLIHGLDPHFGEKRPKFSKYTMSQTNFRSGPQQNVTQENDQKYNTAFTPLSQRQQSHFFPFSHFSEQVDHTSPSILPCHTSSSHSTHSGYSAQIRLSRKSSVPTQHHFTSDKNTSNRRASFPNTKHNQLNTSRRIQVLTNHIQGVSQFLPKHNPELHPVPPLCISHATSTSTRTITKNTANMTSESTNNENVTALVSGPQMIGANFPLAEDGSTYHLETKLTEVANRILTVGDPARAEKISKYLDCVVLDKISHRGFRTITGLYKNVPITIVAIGMGISAMDFFLRECKAVIQGDMAVVRLGTCGVVKPDVPVGTVVVHNSSVGIIRNPDGFRKHIEESDEEHDDEQDGSSVSSSNADTVSSTSDDEDHKSHTSEDDILQPRTVEESSTPPHKSTISKEVRSEPYYVTLPVKSSPALTNVLFESIKRNVGDEWTMIGLNATGDSFYSSQGRLTHHFKDKNEQLIDDVIQRYPSLTTLEMETFHLFDLAQCSLDTKIYAGSCVIVLAQRKSEEFLDTATKKLREKQVGLSILESLIQFPLENEMTEGIWSKHLGTK